MKRKIPLCAEQSPLQAPFAGLRPEDYPEAKGLQPDVEPSKREKKNVQRVVLRRERAMRGGKTVIVITQIPTHLSPAEIEALAKRLRKSLGCGSHVEGRDIEVQGDQAERVRAFMRAEGFEAVGPG